MTRPLTAAEPMARPAPPPPRPPRKPRFRFLRRLIGTVAAIALVVVVVTGLVGWDAYTRFSAGLPTLDGVRNYQPRTLSRIYADDDRLTAELATERRIFEPYEAIPEIVRRAFVSAEDQNFWVHRGVDPLAIARAAVNDLQHVGDNRRPIGASTITQQVARNMLLGSNERSLDRKVKEAILALRIERVLHKPRILELYLNEIYLGQGAYGVAAAAQTYFNKPLGQVTIAEAAMLAALPKSPNNYNPFHFPDAARNRRDWVLDRMVDTHAITAADAAAAKAQPVVPTAYHKPDLVAGAEYFDQEVKRQLVDKFGIDQANQGGLVVHTSYDAATQALADRSLRRGLLAFDRAHDGWRGPVTHLPGLSIDADWATPLANVPRPPGLLAQWRLAVVLSTKGGEAATLGWLDDAHAGTAPANRQHTGLLHVADLAWARPLRHDGELGPMPSRVSQTVAVGDVVMVEPAGTETYGETATLGPESLGRPDRLQLRQIPAIAGALIAMDPNTGRVAAMSGGWSIERSVFNRVTQAQRQPGSSFKPIVYLAAMEQDISPADKFEDAPITIGSWTPENYEMDFLGPTSLHVALAKSRNLVTVRLAQKVGMDAVAAAAIAFHEVDAMPHVLPAALGAVDTTVMREAGAYASLAMGGKEVVPNVIDSVQDRDGHVVWRPTGLDIAAGGDPALPPTLTDMRKPIADPASTFQVLEMMRGVVLSGTGVPVVKDLDRPIAGKTGTTSNFNDAWFAGFTPDLVTVVWVGYDQPASLGDKEDGAHVAGPIWHDFVQADLAGKPALDFRPPEGVATYRWYPGDGHPAVDAFKPGQEPEIAPAPVDTASTTDTPPTVTTPDGTQPIAATPPTPAPKPKASADSGAGDPGMGGLY